MIITISGTPGSGKSNVAKALAKILGAKFYSAGEIRRKFALKHGMTLDELNKKAEKDPESDKLVDEQIKGFEDSKENLVVDARLGFYFLPSSVKVFIDADEHIRAERILGRKGTAEHYPDLKKALAAMKQRQASDTKRYLALYDVDPYDDKHYDLLVDSSKDGVEKLAGDIYRFARFREHRL